VPKKQASEIDAYVGRRVRLRRMLIDMSQEKLGALLGLTFQQVQKYEKGVNRIGAGRLFEMSKMLGVKIDYFYDGVDEEKSSSVSRNGADKNDNPPVMEFVSSGEGMQLSLAYMRIKDAKLRKRVLELVKEIADERRDGEAKA
jgi:transcriptional regulator with XRE-family HTH domain